MAEGEVKSWKKSDIKERSGKKQENELPYSTFLLCLKAKGV